MFESINIRSSVPAYKQVEYLVQFAIASGKLTAGDRLPSVREMAKQLELHPNTVTFSYRNLENLGIVNSRRRTGRFVHSDAEVLCRKACLRHITERLREVIAEAKAAGFSAKEISEGIKSSYASDTGPYISTPNPLLSLVKSKLSQRRSKRSFRSE